MLISPFLEQADDTNFGAIDQIYEYAKQYNVPMMCLTASGKAAIGRWQDLTGAEYPFYTTDATTLKTMIRSNPGLMLIKDGVVVNKWSHNALPKQERLNAPLGQLSIGKIDPTSVTARITKVVLWFALPLFLLTLADRLWTWTKWIRTQRKRSKLYNLLKIKRRKMRQKIVAGNWKMNLNLQEGLALAKEANPIAMLSSALHSFTWLAWQVFWIANSLVWAPRTVPTRNREHTRARYRPKW